MKMKAEIEIGGAGQGRVALNGVDVSYGVRGLTLRSAAGDVSTLELDLVTLDGVRFGGEVQVVIPESTREALLALGWTPPAE